MDEVKTAETPSAEDRELRRRVAVALGVLLLALVLIGLWPLFRSYVLQWGVVPDVSAMTRAEAVAAIEGRHLVPRVVSVRRGEKGSSPVGRIVAQSPVPGTRGNPGAPVTFGIVTGPEHVDVPDVTSMTADAAVERLHTEGFSAVYKGVRLEPREVRGFPLRRTVPPAGTTLGYGAAVELVLGPHLGGTSGKAWAEREHQARIKREGTAACFECHDETWCSDCHVKS